MKFGPHYIYQCPNCNNLISRLSLMSGNTFGMKVYSDLKRDIPMMKEFPNLTKCKKCNHIFKLDDQKEIGKYSLEEKANPEWIKADKAEFLTIYEYFNALSLNIAKSNEEELDIRKRIWWSFNDRVRNSESLFQYEVDKYLWEENLLKLKQLIELSEDNVNGFILFAEIERSLGNFEDCVNMIYNLTAPDLGWLVKLYESKCEEKNSFVFQLGNAGN